MEEGTAILLLALGAGLACVALWSRLDRGLDWLAEHLQATPAAMCGAGLVVGVLAVILGAAPIALVGVVVAASGGVVHRICHAVSATSQERSSRPGRESVCRS